LLWIARTIKYEVSETTTTLQQNFLDTGRNTFFSSSEFSSWAILAVGVYYFVKRINTN